ncbi:spore coat protein CotJB [Lutispora saccharofermentans]|uniref:Spore coat protein CotJB n=1 Tax=Lutispora saccharofermentans TaxID=3024236 RepID=A0ABT1NDD3_9FIRM|nr:spore coat protein CotJB [Lutispora saccharofermentans]MCQ1528198.1 spore coat protein CotJB [Lutispora saccharofermentans]
MKINKERLELLKEIMALEFSMIDLNLYLDTHPRDEKPLMIFAQYSCRLKDLKEKYENEYGPLTPDRAANSEWKWIEEPWPWQIDYEMGGK